MRSLEDEITKERALRNAETPGRYAHDKATYFQAKQKTRGEWVPMGIDEIVTWSRTVQGGRQLPLIQEPPDGGCFRWGLCDG